MVKKTLFAIALVLLVTTANAGIVTHGLNVGNGAAVYVEGSEKWEKTFYWPYWVDWRYETVDIHTIPVKIEIGMYIEIIDCHEKEIILEQVSCGDLTQGPTDPANYPCFKKCIDCQAVSNFDAKLGLKRKTTSEILVHDNWIANFIDGDTIPGDGNIYDLEICVEAWKAKIFKETPGTTPIVGVITITVKPQ
ncbi:MAG: hypothetical protein ACYTFW_10215 [Planctomycetota bacterium]